MTADLLGRFNPGDLSDRLPDVEATVVGPVVEGAANAWAGWARLPLGERLELLKSARAGIESRKEELAAGIVRETGKPIVEARGEVGAVIAKFELTFADAERQMAERKITGGPHPAWVRNRPRGPAAVVAPFNFPLHLGNGALLAHLAAGNTVIFKPSPHAAGVAGEYAAILQGALPPGVFGLVQGGAEEGKSVCMDRRVRSVCFTGSVPAGRALAVALAEDFSKDVALELGGRNASIVCADADLDLAARAIADAMCLTCGQRCNATSRILVDRKVGGAFGEKLALELARYVPGDPALEETKLGPLIAASAVERYERLVGQVGEWLVKGSAPREASGKRGHYVTPAVRRGPAESMEESFVPIADFVEFSDLDETLALHNATPFGLTASVFTRDRDRFSRMAEFLNAGNVYANLPTTFSPSTLPFGGWGESGNGRPGGQGFVRFCTVEQALQIAADGFGSP